MFHSFHALTQWPLFMPSGSSPRATMPCVILVPSFGSTRLVDAATAAPRRRIDVGTIEVDDSILVHLYNDSILTPVAVGNIVFFNCSRLESCSPSLIFSTSPELSVSSRSSASYADMCFSSTGF